MVELVDIFTKENAQQLSVLLYYDTLKVGEYDSYYFGLDQGIEPDLETKEKVELVLKKIIISCLNAIDNNKEFFLPLDFSDQYIGGIWISTLSESVYELTLGYTTEYTGAMIYPSQFIQVPNALNNFVIEDDRSIIAKADLIYSLQNILKNLK